MKNPFALLIIFFLLNCSQNDNGIEVSEMEAPGSLQVFDIGNEGNSSDIRLFFAAGNHSENVEGYRIVITKEGSA